MNQRLHPVIALMPHLKMVRCLNTLWKMNSDTSVMQCNGNFNLEDSGQSGHPVQVKNDWLSQLIEQSATDPW